MDKVLLFTGRRTARRGCAWASRGCGGGRACRHAGLGGRRGDLGDGSTDHERGHRRRRRYCSFAAWRTRMTRSEIRSTYSLVRSVRVGTMLVEASGITRPDAVWRRFTSPSQWPSWAPQIRDVTSTDSRLRLGGTGRVLGPGPLALDYEVIEVDDGLRVWSWEVAIGRARIRMRHYVLPTTDGGSRAVMQVHGPAAVPAQAYRPVARAALRRLVARLRLRPRWVRRAWTSP